MADSPPLLMEEKIVALKPEEPAKEVSASQPSLGTIGETKIKEWKPLYSYFKIEENKRNDGALAKIWEWAKEQSPDQHIDSILFEVIKLNNKLGSAGLGDNIYAKIENYVTIWRRFKEAETILKELETK